MAQQASDALHGLRGRRALIVASTGGHLAQAVRWHRLLRLDPTSHFVTFDSPQSKSLLSQYPHSFLPYVRPRDVRGVARSAVDMFAVQRRVRADVVLSTGAGIALSAIPLATWHRLPFYYLESVSRFDGPSLTGRALSHVPWVTRGTQHRSWASARWPYVGTLLDEYMPAGNVAEGYRPRGPINILVTLGTIRPYRFDRLVDRVARLLRPEDNVTWQLGATMRTDLQGRAVEVVSAAEFQDLARAADVVVTHAGIGTILDLLDLGVSPVVVPRSAAHGEHVDDHQRQAAAEVARRGLGLAVEADALTSDVLQRRGTVTRRSAEREIRQS